MKITRIPSLKSADAFRSHLISLGIDLPCDDHILKGIDSPLSAPVETVAINGKTIGNRYVVQPMEGWDAYNNGRLSEEIVRRWRRFGESGAKLICGGEAMAVRPDGRANPNQLMANRENLKNLAYLRTELVAAHTRLYGTSADLAVGFQLTHSGRFCKPNDHARLEPRVAYRHPILDRRFQVQSDSQVISDGDMEEIVSCYVQAAQVAAEAGADFIDIKHCHGYLLHEFLSAFTRPGKYGGSFENRTRPLREIVGGIRASGNAIELAVRISAFDFVPFRPDPAWPGPRLGRGVPEDYSGCLPYRYAFGVNPLNPVEYDLTETIQFMELCESLGVKIINFSAGSPYYNPHIQRPAAYPPSDGYQPPNDPLIDVARQIGAVRQLKSKASAKLILIGSAYSYLQDYLPHVAQAVVREGWVDMVGIGRAVLSYPTMLADAIGKGVLNQKLICRTFSDCTTAPRKGLVSGCYPLDSYYTQKSEFQELKNAKAGLK
jgi:2,4-dienoyl-CoA reductase-like NADH-dependent reductase (Old Yellow Enzyme family)